MSDPAAPDWDAFTRAAETFGVSLTGEQVAALDRYLQLLCEWNRRFNLTRVERPDEVLTKHFLDSLSCAGMVDFSRQRTLIDVGTGAGFPGLVLKIAFPHLQVTLLDAVQKRLNFLDHVARELQLEGVVTVHARAEDAARGESPRGRGGSAGPPPGRPLLREQFDVATARAVARLNVLAEWLLPFVCPGGVALAMKGPDINEEVDEARRAIRLLGGGEPTARVFTLPGTDLGRSLVRIPKERPTPAQYPRLPGTARKSPL